MEKNYIKEEVICGKGLGKEQSSERLICFNSNIKQFENLNQKIQQLNNIAGKGYNESIDGKMDLSKVLNFILEKKGFGGANDGLSKAYFKTNGKDIVLVLNTVVNGRKNTSLDGIKKIQDILLGLNNAFDKKDTTDIKLKKASKKERNLVFESKQRINYFMNFLKNSEISLRDTNDSYLKEDSMSMSFFEGATKLVGGKNIKDNYKQAFKNEKKLIEKVYKNFLKEYGTKINRPDIKNIDDQFKRLLGEEFKNIDLSKYIKNSGKDIKDIGKLGWIGLESEVVGTWKALTGTYRIGKGLFSLIGTGLEKATHLTKYPQYYKTLKNGIENTATALDKGFEYIGTKFADQPVEEMNKAKIIVLNALNKKFKEFFALKPEEQAKMVGEFFGNIEFTILSGAGISKLVRSVFVRANISHGAKTEILGVEAKKFTYKQSRKALEIFANKLKNAENLDEYKKLIVQIDKIKGSNLNGIDLLDMIEKVESGTISYKKLPKLIRDDVFYLLKHGTRIPENVKKSGIGALSDSITRKAEVAGAKFIESSAGSIYLKVEELAFGITDLLNNSAMKGISMISSAPNESVIYLKKCLKELLDPNSDKLKFLNKHKPRIEKILREFNEKWILEQHEVFNDKLIGAKIKEKFVRTLKFENGFALDFDKKTSTWGMRNLQKKFIIQPNYNYLSPFYEGLAVGERFEGSRKITEILDKSGKILFSEKDINSTYIKGSLVKIEKSDGSTFIFGKNDFKNKLIELNKGEKAILGDDGYVSVKKGKQNSVYALNESSEGIQCLSEISGLKAGEITRLSPKSPYYKLSVNTPNGTKYQIAIDPSVSSLEASLVHIDESKLFDEIISFKKGKGIVKIDGKYHLVKAEKDGINFRFLSHIENIGKFDKDGFASVTFKPFKDEGGIVRQFGRISETGELEIIKLEAKNGVFIESIGDYHRGTAPFKIETGNKKISKWGLIDENKNVIQGIEFDRIHPFSEGYAKVELNGNQGIIDIYGNMVIEPKFKEVVAFLDGEGIVFDGKTYFSYSQTKKTIEKLNIDGISYKKIDGLNRDQSILITKKGDLFGAVDIQGNEILSPTYSNIELSKIEGIFEVFEKDDKIGKIKDFRSEIRSRGLKSSTNLRTTKTDNFTNLLRLEYFNGSRKAMKNGEVIFEKGASPFIQTLGKAKLEDLMTGFYGTKEKLSENFSGLLKKFKKFDLYEYQSQKHQIEIEVKSTITKQMDWFTKKYFEKFNKIKLNNVELSELTRFINEKTREFMNSLENQFKHFSLDPRIGNVKNMEKIFGMFVNKMTKIDYINSRDSRELLFGF